MANYIAQSGPSPVTEEDTAVQRIVGEAKERVEKLAKSDGDRSPDSFHRELGQLLWDQCGMARNAEALKKALDRIPELREEFWNNLRVVGGREELNQQLEKAGRVADFLELAELLCRDALLREESCGGHFREEHQTEEGEAKRNDEQFSYVAAWDFNGVGEEPTLHREPLTFEYVKPTQRSYK